MGLVCQKYALAGTICNVQFSICRHAEGEGISLENNHGML